MDPSKTNQRKAQSPQPPEKPNDSSHDEIESRIDEAVDESFPASDPPAWSGIARSKRERDGRSKPPETGPAKKRSA